MRMNDPRPDCPVCHGPVVFWRSKATPEGEFRISRCPTCGFAFANPRPVAEDLRAFYAESGHGDAKEAPGPEALLARERVYPNSSLDATRLVGTLRSLGASGRLLDVGCGFGFFSREAKRQGFEVTALELGRVERERAAVIAGVQAIALPFEEFQLEGPRFGAVLMSQVLEHVADPPQWLARARTLLAPGGLLAIALPSFDSAIRRVLKERDPYITPPAHLNYFTHESLARLVRAHGFTVERVEDVTRFPSDLVAKRLPLPGPARRLAELGSGLVFRAASAALDRAHAGMMLNLYARAA